MLARDETFGPWSSEPTKNRWDEVKIGRPEQWYEMVSHWFKGSTPVIPEKDVSDTRSLASRQSKASPTSPKASGIPTSTRASGIPTRGGGNPAKTSQSPTSPKKRQNQTISSVETIESPRGTVVERAVPEAAQRAFVSVKYEPREAWAEPRSFEAFLANPQFLLQPWPSVAMSLDEAIGRVAHFLSPRATQNERAAKSPKRGGGGARR